MHPGHEKRTNELRELYEATFSDEPDDPARPLRAAEFDAIDVTGEFGWGLPDRVEVQREDGEVEIVPRGDLASQREAENMARGWMERAELDGGDPRQAARTSSSVASRPPSNWMVWLPPNSRPGLSQPIPVP
jgi:hypothetical protein